MIHLVLVILTGFTITLLWSSNLLIPFKLLSVLVHEIWHGLVALCGGALLEQIHIDLSESGETIVSNLFSAPWLLLTVSAGYLGSTLTGSYLLYSGLAGFHERLTLGLFSCILAYTGYLFTSWGSLAFLVSIGWAGAFALGFLGGRLCSRYILLVLGTLFVWYSLYDLLDFINKDAYRTDAGILAVHMLEGNWPLIPTKDLGNLISYISLTWSILALGIVALFLYLALKATKLAPIKISSNSPASETELPTAKATSANDIRV